MSTVARTILEQLGGNKFIVMTGAKQFTAYDRALSFKIGRNSKSINHITVRLNGSDLYDVEFRRTRNSRKSGYQSKIVAEHKDIYFDQLQEIFTQETGMYTRLF